MRQFCAKKVNDRSSLYYVMIGWAILYGCWILHSDEAYFTVFCEIATGLVRGVDDALHRLLVSEGLLPLAGEAR